MNLRNKLSYLIVVTGLLAAVNFSDIQANVRVMHSWKAISEFIEKDDACPKEGKLVLIDIDDTIGNCGSSIDYAVYRYFFGKVSPKERPHDFLYLRPTENDTVAIINKLQKNGVPMLALTARLCDGAPRVFEQLQDIGIDFSNPKALTIAGAELSTIIDQPINVPMDDTLKDLKTPLVGRYFNGIICANGKYKGIILRQLLTQNRCVPIKVYFVDNELKNAKDVDKAMSEMGIECVSIHYQPAIVNEIINRAYDCMRNLVSLAIAYGSYRFCC